MPRFIIDYSVECEHCGNEIASADMVDHVPDSDSFNTEECSHCWEETCSACKHSTEEKIHSECKEDRDAEEEQDAVQDDS